MIHRASPWTTAELARATGGELAGPPSVFCSGVCTDTRDALSGTVFVALQGERFDAHDFLTDAISRGAVALLVSKAGLARARASGFVPEPGYPIIEVDDTLFALGELGRFHRRRVKPRVLALTGSNGKTTTKELLAAIVGVSRRTLKTEGNLNNLIGVPMTLLGLGDEHEVAVVEMGMNVPGEIARYTAIAEPDVGVIVNVGPAHIGNLGSLDAIGDAKGELFHGMDREKAIAVVNADDPQVVRVARAADVAHQRTFGWSDGADVCVLSWAPVFDADTGLAGGRAIYSVDGQRIEVELPFAGRHIAMNAAAAIATATATTDAGAWSVSLDDVVRGIPRARGAGRRMSFEPVGPYLVVDDCYNANSASMLAAFETVSSRIAALGGRFVAVLGEMRELGAHSRDEHAKVGRAVAERGAAIVAALGTEARALADAAGAPEVRWEERDADALWAWLRPQLRAGDVVLVKGSRGMKMERFVDWLRAHAGVPSTGAGESH
ncbi:UDP-N-acetylmuramoyl-tripeptide--D-alanyl-D-alanine ligase [Myxococcota bacterium]|nr:UDP-N-acetylmuramoyl-tripeptide--D-alanyl-D-alanine ligase [Myxococcota bacterium]